MSLETASTGPILTGQDDKLGLPHDPGLFLFAVNLLYKGGGILFHLPCCSVEAITINLNGALLGAHLPFIQ